MNNTTYRSQNLIRWGLLPLAVTILLVGCATATETPITPSIDQILVSPTIDRTPITPSTPITLPTLTPHPSQTLYPTLLPFPTFTPKPDIIHAIPDYPLDPEGGARPSGAVARLGVGIVLSSDLSPDGSLLVLGTAAGIYVYDTETFNQVWRYYTDYPPYHVSWSPDGTRLLIGDGYKTTLYSASGQKIREVSGWGSRIWSPDGTIFAIEGFPYSSWVDDEPTIRGEPGAVFLYDGVTGLPIRSLGDFVTGAISSYELAWTSDGTAVIGHHIYDETLIIWDVRTGEGVPLPDSEEAAVPISVSPDGAYTVALTNSTTYLLDSASGEIIYTTDRGLGQIQWSPDGAYQAKGVSDGACGDGPAGGGCRNWNSTLTISPVDGETSIIVDYPSTGIGTMGWSSDSTMLAVGLSTDPDGITGISGNEISIINPFTGQELYFFTGHGASVIALAFSPDGRTLASASADGTVIIWLLE